MKSKDAATTLIAALWLIVTMSEALCLQRLTMSTNMTLLINDCFEVEILSLGERNIHLTVVNTTVVGVRPIVSNTASVHNVTVIFMDCVIRNASFVYNTVDASEISIQFVRCVIMQSTTSSDNLTQTLFNFVVGVSVSNLKLLIESCNVTLFGCPGVMSNWNTSTRRSFLLISSPSLSTAMSVSSLDIRVARSNITIHSCLAEGSDSDAFRSFDFGSDESVLVDISPGVREVVITSLSGDFRDVRFVAWAVSRIALLRISRFDSRANMANNSMIGMNGVTIDATCAGPPSVPTAGRGMVAVELDCNTTNVDFTLTNVSAHVAATIGTVYHSTVADNVEGLLTSMVLFFPLLRGFSNVSVVMTNVTLDFTAPEGQFLTVFGHIEVAITSLVSFDTGGFNASNITMKLTDCAVVAMVRPSMCPTMRAEASLYRMKSLLYFSLSSGVYFNTVTLVSLLAPLVGATLSVSNSEVTASLPDGRDCGPVSPSATVHYLVPFLLTESCAIPFSLHNTVTVVFVTSFNVGDWATVLFYDIVRNHLPVPPLDLSVSLFSNSTISTIGCTVATNLSRAALGGLNQFYLLLLMKLCVESNAIKIVSCATVEGTVAALIDTDLQCGNALTLSGGMVRSCNSTSEPLNAPYVMLLNTSSRCGAVGEWSNISINSFNVLSSGPRPLVHVDSPRLLPLDIEWNVANVNATSRKSDVFIINASHTGTSPSDDKSGTAVSALGRFLVQCSDLLESRVFFSDDGGSLVVPIHSAPECQSGYPQALHPSQRQPSVAISYTSTGLLALGAVMSAFPLLGVRSTQSAAQLRLAQCKGVNFNDPTEAELYRQDVLQSRASFFEEPLQLPVVAAQWGVVLGNLLFAVLVALVCCAVVASTVVCKGNTKVWRSEAIRVAAFHRLPGLGCVVVLPLLQPTLVAALQLLQYPTANAVADICIGVLGVAAVLAAVGIITHCLLWRVLRQCTCIDIPPPQIVRRGWQTIIRSALCESQVWKDSNPFPPLFVGHWGVLFESTRRGRQWWTLAEVLGAVACGGVTSFVPSSAQSCSAQLYAMLAVSTVISALCVTLRPFQSRAETWAAVFLSMVQTMCCLLSALDVSPSVVSVLALVASVVSSLLVASAVLTQRALGQRHVFGRTCVLCCRDDEAYHLVTPGLSHSRALLGLVVIISLRESVGIRAYLSTNNTGRRCRQVVAQRLKRKLFKIAGAAGAATWP